MVDSLRQQPAHEATGDGPHRPSPSAHLAAALDAVMAAQRTVADATKILQDALEAGDREAANAARATIDRASRFL